LDTIDEIDPEIIKFLISGETDAFKWMLYGRYYKAAEKVINCGLVDSDECGEIYLKMARRGNLEGMLFLDKKFTNNYKEAIRYAINADSLEMVTYLLNIYETGEYIYEIFGMAIYRNSIEIVKFISTHKGFDFDTYYKNYLIIQRLDYHGNDTLKFILALLRDISTFDVITCFMEDCYNNDQIDLLAYFVIDYRGFNLTQLFDTVEQLTDDYYDGEFTPLIKHRAQFTKNLLTTKVPADVEFIFK
jgi:hypothetical protein